MDGCFAQGADILYQFKVYISHPSVTVGSIPLISSNGLSCTKCQILKLKYLVAIKRLSFSAIAFLRRQKSWFYISNKKKMTSRLRFRDNEPQRFAW